MATIEPVTMTWADWFAHAEAGHLDGCGPLSVELADQPGLFWRQQGDSTVYHLHDGGPDVMFHDKGCSEKEEDVIRQLLRREWPAVTFAWRCEDCGGCGVIRIPGGHGDWDILCCPVCDPDPTGAGFGTGERPGFVVVGPKHGVELRKESIK